MEAELREVNRRRRENSPDISGNDHNVLMTTILSICLALIYSMKVIRSN